ncbi:MAG: ABC transporter ATP-binding protein/permease [Acidobacteriia bacterium]|nr:ABC transporter ATP-binding protein/permease [Terriglobia bacterium]
MRRLVRMARAYWLHLTALLVLGMIQAPLALLTPLPVKLVVDSVLGSRPLPSVLEKWAPVVLRRSEGGKLGLAVALLLLVTLLVYIVSLLIWWLATYTGEKLVLEFRTRLFRHAQRLSLSYHDTKGTTDSTYRIQYDAQCIQVIVLGTIPLLSALFTLVAMIVVTAEMDWKLALIALTVCPLLYLITQTFVRRMRDRWTEAKHWESSAMSVIQEVLASVRLVKAFGREDHEHARFVDRSGEQVQRQVELALLNGQFDLCVGLTMAAGSALVLLVGTLHVKAGTLTLGALLMVMAYLAQLYEPMKTVSKKLGELQSGVVGADRALKLLDELPEVQERAGARPLVKADGSVEFRSVGFSYNPGQPVLKDVCFKVPAGARVGIQGRTGAGKSTLISLLMRFYDPDGGEIRLDDVDLREYRLADLRDQFALVLQDTVLFSTSVAENISYGRPDASRDEIVEAARRANADEFISSLPEGYETQVGERGMKLSGGERQRISLARAFLKNAPILILDEPTSSVDVKTETSIMQAMERLMRGRTTFMIAHRLSTLENCDLRLEMEHGQIRERREKMQSA